MHSFMRSVNRTARCGEIYRQKLLEPDGLNGCQHIYITTICKTPGISQEQLAKAIFINKSNVARQLALLEQNGFITRVPKAEDRRVMRIFPTDKALEVCPKVRQVMQDWREYLLADFDTQQREALEAMLSHVLDRAMQAVRLDKVEGGEDSEL